MDRKEFERMLEQLHDDFIESERKKREYWKAQKPNPTLTVSDHIFFKMSEAERKEMMYLTYNGLPQFDGIGTTVLMGSAAIEQLRAFVDSMKRKYGPPPKVDVITKNLDFKKYFKK